MKVTRSLAAFAVAAAVTSLGTGVASADNLHPHPTPGDNAHPHVTQGPSPYYPIPNTNPAASPYPPRRQGGGHHHHGHH